MYKRIITTVCVLIVLISAVFAGNSFLNLSENKSEQDVVLKQNQNLNDTVEKTEEKENISTESEVVPKQTAVPEEKHTSDNSLSDKIAVNNPSVDENTDKTEEKESIPTESEVVPKQTAVPEEKHTSDNSFNDKTPVSSSSVDENTDEIEEKENKKRNENEKEIILEEKIEAAQENGSKPDEVVVTEKVVIPDDSLTCVLSVNCSSVLENIHKLKEDKKELIPKDGIILKEIEVEFLPDESVFDVLQRELKNNNIHFEFVKTPAYNSVYIEGIANLYEFDCGELSGWLYKVNGVKPTYGCSQYKLKNNDKIEFFYSCNMFE